MNAFVWPHDQENGKPNILQLHQYGHDNYPHCSVPLHAVKKELCLTNQRNPNTDLVVTGAFDGPSGILAGPGDLEHMSHVSANV